MNRLSEIEAVDRVEPRQDEPARLDSVTLDAAPAGDRALPPLVTDESTSQRALWLGAMLVIVSVPCAVVKV